MTTPYLSADIERDEGREHVAYPDPITKAAPWTIGVGHTGREVHPGLVWADAMINDAKATDIMLVQRGLDTALAWWRTLSDPRQDVLVNMAFNMGVHGLLEFQEALAAMRAGHFAGAAVAMLESQWARQLPDRSARLATQMSTGVRAL